MKGAQREGRGCHRQETRLISTLHPLARTKPQLQCQWQARSSCSALYLPDCLLLVCPVNCQLPRPFISAALTPNLKANTRTHTHQVRSHICSLSGAPFFALPALSLLLPFSLSLSLLYAKKARDKIASGVSQLLLPRSLLVPPVAPLSAHKYLQRVYLPVDSSKWVVQQQLRNETNTTTGRIKDWQQWHIDKFIDMLGSCYAVGNW